MNEKEKLDIDNGFLEKYGKSVITIEMRKADNDRLEGTTTIKSTANLALNSLYQLIKNFREKLDISEHLICSTVASALADCRQEEEEEKEETNEIDELFKKLEELLKD